MAGGGSVVVRLIASPFIIPRLRPFQQVELLVDGVRLGGCRMTDIAVLELVLPAEMLAENNHLALTLRLPIATGPREVLASEDHREQALAVRGMTILRVLPAATRYPTTWQNQ
jgi:hypothetical protein